MVTSVGLFADDSEIYVYESSARTGDKPQVLIIFDTSRSMENNDETISTFYDRGKENIDDDNKKIYYTLSAANIPLLDSQQYFYQKVNGCNTAKTFLSDYGMFTGFLRHYVKQGDLGTWKDIPLEGGEFFSKIDCFEDIDSRNPVNTDNDDLGYPVDNEKNAYIKVTDKHDPVAIEKALLTQFGTGQPLTLYTDKYVKWFHNQNNHRKTDYTRLAIAKRVIEDTVVTAPGVDFGLAIFNGSRSNGGRIIREITSATSASRLELINKVSLLHGYTGTPLCETLFEAYRYFSGKAPYYAKDFSNDDYESKNPLGIFPAKYTSPFEGKKCQNKAFIVYITDGSPYKDNDIDRELKRGPFFLKDRSNPDNPLARYPYKDSFLRALAHWMSQNDLRPNQDGLQTVTTFTIGFSQGAGQAEGLLKATAQSSGGKFFRANDALELQEALQTVFSDIMAVNSSFTSPSIASNNFDRTQTDDSVYYAMFLPNKGPRWAGNLKKFKVNSTGDIIDKRGNLAIDNKGNLSSSACSYWTLDSVCNAQNSHGDGNEVLIGGASDMLQRASERMIYGNFGTNDALVKFSVANASAKANRESHVTNYRDLSSYMGVNKSQLTDLFNWAMGIDVDDDNGNNSHYDKRQDIIGDPLHSKPLAINLGTKSKPDIRILMGTNHGMLHMFKDNNHSVFESWAMIPYQFLPQLKGLRANVPTGVHSVYGLDMSPIAHITYKFVNGEKVIDKAWVFVGMRRGGTNYYALDITKPDNPKFMWKIDNNIEGMDELGQSWSEPVITYIPGYRDSNTNKPKPVFIIGGGYFPPSKDGSAVGSHDAKGRAVFFIDAETGVLVHKFDPIGGTKATKIPNIKDSIPNAVAILDSNNDGVTDRIYATDTGANVWRIDMPSADKRLWSAYKFAQLGGDTIDTDRRFFAKPVVAKTKVNFIPYDAVAVGTGHRAHPLNLDRKDMFFMLQDKNVVTKSYVNNPPLPITLSNLKDISLIKNVGLPDKYKNGWVYQFKSKGEKSLAAAAIIQGRIFFTSYVPGDIQDSKDKCLAQGEGRLYGFDLHSGKRAFINKNETDKDNPIHDYISMGSRVPDTPQLVIPSGGNDNMYLIGIGNAGNIMEKTENYDGCDINDQKCISAGLRTNKIYYHIAE